MIYLQARGFDKPSHGGLIYIQRRLMNTFIQGYDIPSNRGLGVLLKGDHRPSRKGEVSRNECQIIPLHIYDKDQYMQRDDLAGCQVKI